MGIINSINQWLTTLKDNREAKEINKLRGLLDKMNKLQVYNPYRAGIPKSLYDDNKFTKQLSESYVWFQGQESALNDFYKGKTGITENSQEASYFWYASPEDGSVRRVHSGLPKLISITMPTVLFGNGYKINATAYQEDGASVDELRSQEIQEVIDLLAAQQGINVKQLLEQSSITESWAGDVAWKIAIDTTLSPYPILMASDPRNYEPIVQKGITIGIKFKDYVEVETTNGKKVKYIINEIYTTDSKDGTSLIVYTVDMVKENGNRVSVQLNQVPDENINALINQPSVILSEDGLSATIRFDGLKGMLAWHKPNRVNASDGYNSLYGESDHVGNFSNYDAIDEAGSVIIEEARMNKDIRYIPDEMLQRDDNGRVIRLNDFVRNYKVVRHNPDQNSKNEMTFSHFADKTQQHLEKWKVFLGLACANASVSPLTLGLTNVVSMANSDKTLQERSRVTLEMRKKKLQLWGDFLEKAFYKLLETYNYMWNTYPEVKARASFEAVEASEMDMTINVSFADYNEMGVLDRAKEWSVVLTQGGISHEQYVERVYGDDMTKEQKMKEVNTIKIEKNIGLNNPELLTLADLEETQ